MLFIISLKRKKIVMLEKHTIKSKTNLVLTPYSVPKFELISCFSTLNSNWRKNKNYIGYIRELKFYIYEETLPFFFAGNAMFCRNILYANFLGQSYRISEPIFGVTSETLLYAVYVILQCFTFDLIFYSKFHKGRDT